MYTDYYNRILNYHNNLVLNYMLYLTINLHKFYFVNSYCFNPDDDKSVIATTTYNEKFASIIGKNNILGVQFHPERSGPAGLKILEEFISV